MSDPNAKIPAAQAAETKRAMAEKADAPKTARPAAGQTADPGMNPTPNREIAPSGALDAEGQRPVLERSRKVR